MCRKEKIRVLNKLCSGTSYGAVAMNSMLMNQQYMLNKVSLKRNTHQTRLNIDRMLKMLPLEALRNLTVFPLGAMVQYSLIRYLSIHS